MRSSEEWNFKQIHYYLLQTIHSYTVINININNFRNMQNFAKIKKKINSGISKRKL